MSLLEPPPCDDDFNNFGDSKRTSGCLANVTEFIDPQYTVKQYGPTQLGYMTPDTSPIDTTPRRGSFASNYFCGSSAASSFMSHSGNVTPSLATPGSSATSSRRQSMLTPECQQYYLSATPSSPSDRFQGPKKAAATDQCPLQDSSPAPYLGNTNVSSLTSDGAAACVPEGQFAIMVGDLIEKAPGQWQYYSPQTASPSLYRTLQTAQTHESTDWGCDLEAKLHSPITARTAHTIEYSQPLFGHAQPSIFEDSPSYPGRGAYNTEGNSSPDTPSLAPPIEFDGVRYNPDMGITDNDMVLNAATSVPSFVQIFKDKTSPPSDDNMERDHVSSRNAKNHNRRHRQSQGAPCELISYTRESKTKSHQCQELKFDGKICDYACNRQEHLARHKKSKHMNENTEMLPCGFHGCKDRKTGKQREIVARVDNLKAHYTKTHFRYGSSEKGGKNERKSMKAAHEMGLSIYDHRWTLLFRDKMSVNEEIKHDLHVWKMLGYSIRETRDMKVKDVSPPVSLPDCTVLGDDPLQKYDPRWKALWNGTLTFDKAMTPGRDMEESEAQGLLGVTMLETEAMGIRHLDPRWTVLLNSRMSVEQSEKLGVKQRNPKWKELVARRRARCGVEKLND